MCHPLRLSDEEFDRDTASVEQDPATRALLVERPA